MKLSGQSRILAALIALMAMLFTQLAVASYACPTMHTARAAASAAAVDPHHMSGCEGMNTTIKPLLCHEQAQAKSQSADNPKLPNVQPFMATMLMRTIGHADHYFHAVVPPNASLVLTRTTAPPLGIRNCCFRI